MFIFNLAFLLYMKQETEHNKRHKWNAASVFL